MNIDSFPLELETQDDAPAIEALAALVFGPGRFTRTAFRLREGVPQVPELSFVVRNGNALLGSVRLTTVKIDHMQGLLLGPLVVAPEFKNAGIGRKLMWQAVKSAKEQNYPWIILVGDEPYYSRFGFEIVKRGSVKLPGPVDPDRLLICELDKAACKDLSGLATSS
ncbi:MAG: N-acetyltransferase [Pseudomonadota bacterium]